MSETGEFFATSADIDKQKLINLMNNDVTKESFMLTLKSDKMIIGRAYYFAAVKKWVIPLRKTVRQRSGKIIGVVTTGIDLDSISRITQSNPIKSSMRSMVINDSGLWRVYIDGPSRRNSDFYSKPASKELYDNAVFQLMSKYGVTVNTIKESERTYIYTSYAKIEDGISINAVSYISRYGLWAITLISEKSILSTFFYLLFYVKLVGFFLSLGALGFLFIRGAPQKSDRCDSYSTRRGEHTCPSERIMPRLSRPEWP